MFNDLQSAHEGGLDCTQAPNGMLKYSDDISEVVYRSMVSKESNPPHVTDGFLFNSIGIFTRPINTDNYKYCGYISQKYKFIGNEILNNKIRQSIREVGLPVLMENRLYNDRYTRMRNEIIISSSQNIPQVGDVLPVLIVSNTYDGTGAQSISFGMCINENSHRYVFSFKMGEMRQIHIANSTTSLNTAINTYSRVFTENITEVITSSFEKQITPDEIISILAVVETIGKRKREQLSNIFSSLTPAPAEGAEPVMPSAWQVFLALVRYTSLEPNLNVKKILESVTERVLVIPKRMFEVLEELQN